MPRQSTAIEKSCAVCGESYRIKASHAAKSKYCSRACQDAARRSAPRKTTELICPQCGRPFQVMRGMANRRKFCSTSCARKAQPLTDIVHTNRQCQVCGGTFRSHRESQRFCSSECWGTAQRGARRPAKGRVVDKRNGYVYIYMPDHPNAVTGGRYVAEHRLVAERKLGRLLERHEVVHHIDRNGGNNDPDNLQVMTQREHAALHAREGW